MTIRKYANLLESTFIHLNGFNRDKEKSLWDSGIIDINQLREEYFGNELKLFDDLFKPTSETEIALNQENSEFFLDKLPSSELYRIALTYFKDTIFLDIETTGLSRHYSYITIIGWIINGKYKYWIKGESYKVLLHDLAKAKLIITFNGTLFDIPFIKKEFPDIKFPLTHIDLRFFSRRFGYSGGQKVIEDTLKIKRPKAIKDIDGKEAVVLWYKYLSNDLHSLEMLLKYNYYDIVGMQRVFDRIIEKHLIRGYLPKFSKSIYRFSDFPASFKTDISNNTHTKTKKVIKSYNINELLTDSTSNGDIKVIGIDLTGSEAKASGCCILENNIAFTCLLKTDNELIDYIISNKPLIVSIDSPLSLPQGRVIISDDDQGRDIYGITRFCERELKKRGINVYPCLIQSMQKLTERGMYLAKRIRSLGIPVIESFPGAAQDILKIPRKRTDMHFLKKGLLDFGVVGDFEHTNISHDELDAITSALVGYFFWEGKFEALGNPDEEYLIIPDIDIKKQKWGHRRVIGFSGPIATGKTTAAMVLKEKGFKYVRFSQVLEGLLNQEGIEVNRSSLQKFGNDIFKVKGQYWLCKKLIQEIPDKGDIVIDGLRHPEDHAFFTESYGPDFIHIFIDSNSENRKNRYIAQKNRSIKEFEIASRHQVEQNTEKLMSLAHMVIQNNTQKIEYEKKVLKLLN